MRAFVIDLLFFFKNNEGLNAKEKLSYLINLLTQTRLKSQSFANYFHENKDLSSWKKKFIFTTKNIYLRENNAEMSKYNKIEQAIKELSDRTFPLELRVL